MKQWLQTHLQQAHRCVRKAIWGKCRNICKKMRKVSKWCFFTTSSLTWFQNITSTFLYETATIPSNKSQHKPRKQCLPYTRSLLRPILVHTSPNARPIKGIGQAGHKDGFNMGPITRRALIWNGLHTNRADGTARHGAFDKPETLNVKDLHLASETEL